MTREQMLLEIAHLRTADGGSHKIGITGKVGDWNCEIDGKHGQGATPMEAYEAAKQVAGL